MPKLIKSLIDQTVPSERLFYLWDSQLPGFGVKITPSGRKNFILKYRVGDGGRQAQQRWYLIGQFGVLTVDQARQKAIALLADINEGRDPQAVKRCNREAPRISDLWERFDTEHLPRRKPKTQQHYRSLWNRYIEPSLGNLAIQDVRRDNIQQMHGDLGNRPYQANRLLSVCSKLFSFAEQIGLRDEGTNPCRHIEKYAEKSRQRYLNTEELKRLGTALVQLRASHTITPYVDGAVRLLLLTGMRVSEVLAAEWEWVQWDVKTVELPDSKTGRKTVFLSNAAMAVLSDLNGLKLSRGERYIIRGRHSGTHLVNLAKPWVRLCQEAELKNIRLHDLRHTHASIGMGEGISLAQIGHLLGHSQTQTTLRYAHLDRNPAHAATNKIGEAMVKWMH